MRIELESFRRRVGAPSVAGAVVSAGSFEFDVVGTTRRDGADSVAPGDAWHIGSCSKSVTAALYARLVEKGMAEWGTPLPELFPDLNIHPRWSDRTVDDVFHCRSGMRSNPTRAELRAGWGDGRPLTEQRTAMAATALSEAPGPRGRFVYSNLGYLVAGAAIDRLAGRPYEAALDHEILAPLGIDTAGFGPPPKVWGHAPRLQLGSACLFRGRPADPAHPKSDNPPVLSSAGTMHLSVEDWARFVRLFLIGGGDLLGPGSIEHLLRVPDGRGRPMSMGWARSPDEGVSYGMQGSNARWAATALLDDGRERASLVVVNDGRTTVLMRSAQLALRLLGPRASAMRGSSTES